MIILILIFEIEKLFQVPTDQQTQTETQSLSQSESMKLKTENKKITMMNEFNFMTVNDTLTLTLKFE